MSVKIGFIGGGNMAEGIIRGLIRSGTYHPEEILVKEIRSERLGWLTKTYGIRAAESYEALTADAETIVLAVRPQDAETVCGELSAGLEAGRHILVSICAGIRMEHLNLWTGAAVPVARIMPNTMIDVSRGFSALAFNASFPEERKADVRKITDSIGKTLPLAENQFDAFTATSCAGPEWLILFAQALIDGAVETGLSRADASAIVYENMIGAGMMLSSTEKHPSQITDEMNTPGGIGIAGLHSFMSGGLHGITMDAVGAAFRRTVTLGKPGES